MNNIERFKSLGGTFELSGEWVNVIFNNMSMHLPAKYFSSTYIAEQEVVDYYLDVIPKIYNNRQDVQE